MVVLERMLEITIISKNKVFLVICLHFIGEPDVSLRKNAIIGIVA